MKIAGVELPPLLANAARECRPHFLAAFGFSLLVNLLYLAPAIYMLQIFDRVVPTGGVATLAYITLALAIALLSLAALDAIRLRLLVRASLRLDSIVAPKLLKQTITSGAAGTQAMRDFDTVRSTVASPHRKSVLDYSDRVLVLDAGRPRLLGDTAKVVAQLAAAPKAETAA